MQVHIKKLIGSWNDGYALDKHMLSSTFGGYDEYGHAQFDNRRSEAGEAVYQLKYRGGWSNSPVLAQAVVEHILPRFPSIGLIVPMPASTARMRQPVDDVANEIGKLISVPVFGNIIVKAPSASGVKLKDLTTRQEKDAELAGKFSINDAIQDEEKRNALLLDDLYDSGASMHAAANVLRSYSKIGGIYAAALTWK